MGRSFRPRSVIGCVVCLVVCLYVPSAAQLVESGTEQRADESRVTPWIASPAKQACCDLTGVNRSCFDDEIGAGTTCTAPATGLGVGTSCAANCPCGEDCAACLTKQSGNLADVEIELTDRDFDGVNTTFTYRICQLEGAALSHWVLGLDEVCCDAIVSTTGGSTTGTCAVDPTSGLLGLRFDTAPPPACSETACGEEGDLFTIVLSGNVGVGCIKVANKSGSTESISTACIQGPDCSVVDLCEGVDCGPMDTECETFACDSETGECVGTPRPPSTPCEADGDLCTNDHCDGKGSCVANPADDVVCPPDEVCETFECDPATGECSGTPIQAGEPCESGDLCMLFACDGAGSCIFVEERNPGCTCALTCSACNPDTGNCEPTDDCDGTECEDDGFACTDDLCMGGACAHEPIPGFCDDGDPCTEDICDPDNPDADADGCVFTPLPEDTPCESDGNLCTIEACSATGFCRRVDTVDCSCFDDCGLCNRDTGQCEPSFACDGSPCADDGASCTSEECFGGECFHTPFDGACDDGIECTKDRCDPDHPDAEAGTGCVFAPVNANCTDGDVCTDDACAPGVPGADPVTGCLFVENDFCGACCDPAQPGGVCDDRVEPDNCVGGQLVHFAGETCEAVEAEMRCLEHTGACCDRRIADPAERCVDDVPQSECVIDDPNQVRWFKDTACADLTPEECSEHTGACCDELHGICMDDGPASMCPEVVADPNQWSWTKETPCSEVVCDAAAGACCNADAGPLVKMGLCTITTLAECQCDTCTWTKGAVCENIECDNIFVAIPTVSEWGMVVLSLLLLIGAKLYFGFELARRRGGATA